MEKSKAPSDADDGIHVAVDVGSLRRTAVVRPGRDVTWADVLSALRPGAVDDLSVDGVPVRCGWPVVALQRGSLLTLGVAKTRLLPKCPDSVPLVVRVLTGPLAGSTIGLPAGTTVFGREQLGDPTVSVRHAAFHVIFAPDGEPVVHVADLASTNGTTVEGLPIGQGWHPIEDNASMVVAFGRCLLRAEAATEVTAAPRLLGRDGRIPVQRSPRLNIVERAQPIGVPAAQKAPGLSRLRLSTMFLPLILAAVMVKVTHQLTFALFALLSPLTMLGNHLEDRGKRRSVGRRGAAQSRAELAAFEAETRDSRAVERRRRFDQFPDLARIAETCAIADAALWARQPDHSDSRAVVLGYASQRWQPPLRPEPTGSEPDHIIEAIERTKDLGEVPLVTEIVAGRCIGIHGEREAVRAMARSLLIQAAAHRSPADLAISVAPTAARERWAWTHWLPHRGVGDGEPAGDDRSETTDVRDQLFLLDLLDEPRPVPHRFDAARSRSVIALALTPERLPAGCGVVIHTNGQLAEVIDLTHGVRFSETVALAASAEFADAVARSLAPYADVDLVDDAAMIPIAVPLVGMLGVEGVTRDNSSSAAMPVQGRWEAARGQTGLAVPVGRDENGLVVVDLVADGPHALVAGTTGSGKSELLRSWLVALAATYSPDELNFVLIDYKGGSAFAACASLPHTAGLVTDLDGHLAARALRCLDAEIVRRERILRDAEVMDLPALVVAGGHLPRLVVVIDEFATLAAEVPGFVDALVGVAQRGRSLGLHLVLATQRPSGAVSENIRANTNMRISLRVQSSADSVDVIGDPAAARLPRRVPGRALIRLGPGELTTFQAAYCGGSATAAVALPAASWTDEDHLCTDNQRADDMRADDMRADDMRAEFTNGATAAMPRDDDLTSLVSAICAAAIDAGTTPPHRPWPDPLPPAIALPPTRSEPAETLGLSVEIGVADLPDQQRWESLIWQLDRGPLLVTGPVGSGVTSTLTAAACSAARDHSPDHLQLHVIDFGVGALLPLRGLPHAGDILGLADRERLRRCARWLDGELSVRRAALVTAELSRWSDLVGPDTPPRVLIVIDQYQALRSELDSPDGHATLETLHRVIADGTAVGLHVAVGVDRLQAVPAAVLGAFVQRLVLGARERFEVAMAGAKVDELPPPIPGRGIDIPEAREVQIFQVEGLVEVVAHLHETWGAPSVAAHRSPVLPTAVARADLGMSGVALPVGLGDRDVGTVGFDLVSGEGLMVVGPGRSGRSSTLALLARQVRSADPERALMFVTPRTSTPMERAREMLGDAVAVVASDAAAVADAARAVLDLGHRVALFIDDAEHLDDPTRALERLLLARPPGLWVCAAGRVDALRSAYGHWTMPIRRTRTGIALRPNLDTDGDVFATPLPRRGGPFPPGRGCLIRDGDVEVVQLALWNEVARELGSL